MADLRCKGCKDFFDNQKVINQHIGASPSCLDFYDNKSSHVSSYLEHPSCTHPSPTASIRFPSPAPAGPSIPWPDINYDRPSPPHNANPEENAPKRQQVTIEEVKDEDSDQAWTYEKFLKPVATSQGSGVTTFSDLLAEQHSMHEHLYALFEDWKEWGLVKWLMRRTTQSGADEYLKLEIVSPLSCASLCTSLT